MIVRKSLSLDDGTLLEIGTESSDSDELLLRVRTRGTVEPTGLTTSVVPVRLVENILRSADTAKPIAPGRDDLHSGSNAYGELAQQRTLSDLLELVTAENCHEELPTGSPVGKEAW